MFQVAQLEGKVSVNGAAETAPTTGTTYYYTSKGELDTTKGNGMTLKATGSDEKCKDSQGCCALTTNAHKAGYVFGFKYTAAGASPEKWEMVMESPNP